jgi:hypothetical protein
MEEKSGTIGSLGWLGGAHFDDGRVIVRILDAEGIVAIVDYDSDLGVINLYASDVPRAREILRRAAREGLIWWSDPDGKPPGLPPNESAAPSQSRSKP